MDVGRRDALIEALKGLGADARVFFWPLGGLGLFEPRPCPVAADISARALNLPSAAFVDSADIAAVARRLWPLA
jgi:dTDP-4-amino-4,6-dideoxygalactose transaminase